MTWANVRNGDTLYYANNLVRVRTSPSHFWLRAKRCMEVLGLLSNARINMGIFQVRHALNNPLYVIMLYQDKT